MDFEDALMTLHIRKLDTSLDSDFAEALDIIIDAAINAAIESNNNYSEQQENCSEDYLF